MFCFKSMKARLIAIMFSVSLATSVCLGSIVIYSSVQENERLLQAYREDLEKNARIQLQNQTQSALSIVQDHYRRQISGELTREQAMRQSADIIRMMRYNDGTGYFTIDTDDGVNVVLRGTAAEGKPRLDAMDPEGNYFIQDIIRQAKQPSGGFTAFMYPKPETNNPLPKLYYSIEFRPYHWVIGTGVWIDQIDRMVAAHQSEMNRHVWEQAFRTMAGLGVMGLLLILMAIYIGRRLAYPIQIATQRMRALGNGFLEMDGKTDSAMKRMAERHDELGTMSRAMQEMSRKLCENQQLILRMAREDALTGLANRRYFTESIRKHPAGKPLTLISLDLDHFKEVNDRFGHQTGDAALLILAEVLRQSFADAMTVRMGGDEFLVAMTGPISREKAEQRLTSFMKKLIHIYQKDNSLCHLTISAGIAFSVQGDVPVDVLLHQSDEALYAAKLAGRSCYRVYTPADDMSKKEG